MRARNAEAYYRGVPMGTREQVADAYRASIRPQSEPLFSGMFSRPLSETLNRYVSDPNAMPGAFLNMLVPGAGYALGAIGDFTRGLVARNFAMEQQGVPGYSTGIYDGRPFSISPSFLGGRALTGSVGDLTVQEAERRMAEQGGIVGWGAKAAIEAEEAMGEDFGPVDFGGYGEIDAGAGADVTEAQEAAEMAGEEDPTFNTGGPVRKRRGFRETATSPLAAGSFIDKPLYDRAVEASPTYRRW
jgi:hypothetical protein